jgi:uncharacterized HhH-GPD family protein
MMGLDLPDIDADGGDFAFLLGVLFNQRVRSEMAWKAPARLAQRLGYYDSWQLAAADPGELAAVIMRGPALHPWGATMARNIIGSCGVLIRDYGGQARSIWADQPSGEVLLRRLSSFPGIGRHKASVAIALLMLEYGQVVSGGAGLAAQAMASCPRLATIIPPPLRYPRAERISDAPPHSPLRQ